MKISGKIKVLVAVIAALLFIVALMYSATGFYCKVPVWSEGASAPSSPGETVWFTRRTLPFGFVSSADGIAIERGFSPNSAVRNLLDTEFERLADKRIIGRFGFSRTLYLLTTGNVDLYSPENQAVKGKPSS